MLVIGFRWPYTLSLQVWSIFHFFGLLRIIEPPLAIEKFHSNSFLYLGYLRQQFTDYHEQPSAAASYTKKGQEVIQFNF